MSNLKSARTLLRRLKPSDLANMRRLESEPSIMKFTPSRIPQTEEQTRSRMLGQIEKQSSFEPFGIWVAEMAADSTFAGWFMLLPREAGSVELGFMIVKELWGNGLATEVARALVDFARAEGSLTKVVASTNLDNVASIRTLEKIGFKFAGTKAVPEPIFGGEITLKEFVLNF